MREGSVYLDPLLLFDHMKDSDKKSIVPRIWYALILTAATVLHILLTFVLILFVLSTVSIINTRMMHIEIPESAEIIIAVVLFAVSIIVFLRSFKKLSQFIKQNILKDFQL